MSHPIAFNATLAELQAHRMVGEAYRYYQQHDAFDCYQGERDALNQAYRSMQLRALKQASALIELNQALSSCMPVIHFKGLTLSQLLYQDIGVRTCRDLDILIPFDQQTLAFEIFHQLGYGCRYLDYQANDAEKHYAFTTYKDIEYTHGDTGNIVEVHTRLHGTDNQLPMATGDVWQQASTMDLGSKTLSIMDPLHYLCYLISHGCVSAYYRYHWLCDVIGFAKQFDINWEEVVDHFIRYEAQALLLFTFHLAHRFFCAPIPPVVSALSQSAAISRRAKKLCRLNSKIVVGMHPQLLVKKNVQQRWQVRVKPFNTARLCFTLKKSLRYKLACYKHYFRPTEMTPGLKRSLQYIGLFELLKPLIFLYIKLFRNGL